MAMKKAISSIAALALAGIFSVTALAAAEPTVIDQNSPEPSGKADILTNVEPEFTVSIPGDTNVAFGAEHTDFGKVELVNARLEPGKAIEVSVESNGKLENSADNTKTIAYSLTYSSDMMDVPESLEFSVMLLKAGENFGLTIDIEAQEWEAAAAGQYSGTVDFNIACVDAPEGNGDGGHGDHP